MSAQVETTLRLTRVVDAEAETVFRAWTEPAQMKKWCAPEGMTVAEAESDLKVGGRYLIRMKNPEGGFHTAVGEYREIERPNRLVYTWDWEEEGGRMRKDTVVTVEFNARGDGSTEVVLTHDLFPSQEAKEQHAHGWTSCLDRLEQMFA